MLPSEGCVFDRDFQYGNAVRMYACHFDGSIHDTIGVGYLDRMFATVGISTCICFVENASAAGTMQLINVFEDAAYGPYTENLFCSA